VYGVVKALAATGKIGGFTVPQVPLLATAVVSLIVLIASDILIVRRPKPPRANTAR